MIFADFAVTSNKLERVEVNEFNTQVTQHNHIDLDIIIIIVD